MGSPQLKPERRHGSTEAIEDYAKAIYSLQQRVKGDAVSTGAIADRLAVSPGAVTTMLKRMAEMGLAEHRLYHGVTLTPAGEKVALEVMRHHRLIESYLAQALGMSWDKVHAEAEVLEHYISEDLEELMATALDNPSHDPHGDPIPDRQLEIAEEPGGAALAELDPGEGGRFARVSDSDPEMLRYLAEREIFPGAELQVSAKEPFGGPLTIECGGVSHVFGGELVQRMRISRD